MFSQIRRTLTASSLCDEAASPVKITGEVRVDARRRASRIRDSSLRSRMTQGLLSTSEARDVSEAAPFLCDPNRKNLARAMFSATRNLTP